MNGAWEAAATRASRVWEGVCSLGHAVVDTFAAGNEVRRAGANRTNADAYYRYQEAEVLRQVATPIAAPPGSSGTASGQPGSVMAAAAATAAASLANNGNPGGGNNAAAATTTQSQPQPPSRTRKAGRGEARQADDSKAQKPAPVQPPQQSVTLSRAEEVRGSNYQVCRNQGCRFDCVDAWRSERDAPPAAQVEAFLAHVPGFFRPGVCPDHGVVGTGKHKHHFVRVCTQIKAPKKGQCRTKQSLLEPFRNANRWGR